MFGRKSKALMQQLQDVTDRMTELTRVVEKLQDTAGHNSRINIEKLEIEQAFLDELVFRLESLDIEELSGSLNLGNNFSPTVDRTSSSDSEPEKNPDSVPDVAGKTQESRTIGTLANGRKLKTTTTGYLMSL